MKNEQIETYTLKVGNWEIQVESQDMADEGLTYTQENAYLLDEEGNELLIRRWIGCLDGIEDCNNPIQFGEYGYYSDWECI